ncbi:dihydroxyacetone kinase family protein [Spelaeicoccus albus]|uniref:Dihydroxyacetone kinase n=1 Tax=Spelaeicoccus albus TaxID=1280376 RepID=A0A7Z0D0E1_9MICO|nr:dihydroxyacetone kinase family protein [Spelaeicoccus albus]NYI67241.1 dihydroxyacetone kinase [Spelaeicoccus albus]
MTRLFNEPSAFSDELAEGFVAANPAYVRKVPGGVVRATKTAGGSVAVVVGGGSGHYPAFAGLVGRGMAHGAAMGNIFASPSAHQVYDVARAAEHGGGVILSFGNYAGDVLHFGQAAERLNAEGIRTEIVTVTDDVASAPPDEIAKRRGIAGDLTVFKVAGAAADAGYDFDEVVRVARQANDRTRSFGVAFAGCTLPGADEPLFTVPEGRMSLGLGIHGEPGISEADIPTADGLADLFVDKLLAERPDGADARVAAVLNGLGTVKYEELFVVYRRVSKRLADAGLTIVEPEVGELCTSLDMAGASLTLCWLDDELERLWTAPADAPAFRKGSMGDAQMDDARGTAVSASAEIPAASEESRRVVPLLLDVLRAIRQVTIDGSQEFGRIDAVAGDGDHGIGMERGARAGVDAAESAASAGAGAGTVLQWAADAWADKAGGTSGALWGVLLGAVAQTFGDTEAVHRRDAATALEAGTDAVMRLGKAELGDKTMVDVLVPFSQAVTDRIGAGNTAAEAWTAGAAVADAAAAATADLTPKIGRARPLADKSIGTPDAGAVSLARIVGAVAAVLNDARNDSQQGENA